MERGASLGDYHYQRLNRTVFREFWESPAGKKGQMSKTGLKRAFNVYEGKGV